MPVYNGYNFASLFLQITIYKEISWPVYAKKEEEYKRRKGCERTPNN